MVGLRGVVRVTFWESKNPEPHTRGVVTLAYPMRTESGCLPYDTDYPISKYQCMPYIVILHYYICISGVCLSI